MILRAFYDIQYISLVLARTNMAEKPKKKLVPKSRSIEEDKNNWINNIKVSKQQSFTVTGRIFCGFFYWENYLISSIVAITMYCMA